MAGEFNATQGAGLLKTYIEKKFIAALERDLQAQKFTTKVVIPPGMGKNGRVVTFSNAPGSTSAITDGTLGNNVDITVTSSNVTIQEFGEYMAIHRIQEYASAPGMREEIVKRFRHGGLVSLDGTVLSKLNATTTLVSQFSATAPGSIAFSGASVPVAANAAGLISARKRLKDAYAVGFSGISGHTDGHYAAIIGQQAEVDIVTEITTGRMYWSTAVVNVPGRAGQEKWVNGYIGSIYATAVYTSQNITTGLTVSSTNVSNNFVLADGAVAAMAFEDMEPEVYVNLPSGNSTDNPYRNFSTVAWHAYFGSVLHDGNRVVKIYSAGS